MVGRLLRLILLACAATCGPAGGANAQSSQLEPEATDHAPAAARGSGARLQLDHAAPSSCPSAAELLARVEARAAPSVLEEPAEPQHPALAARVRILRTASGYDGRIELVGREQLTRRAVSGASCDEVTSALAVIIGLALGAPASAVVPAPAPPRTEPGAMGTRLGLGLGAMLHSAPAPEPLLGGLLVLTADVRRGWAPATSLSLGRGRSDPVRTPEGDARFTLSVGSLAICPWRWLPHPTIAGGPCVRADLGALRGWGSGTEADRRSVGLWFAPGASLDWALTLDRLLLSASAGFALPLVRDRFVLREQGSSSRERLLHQPASTDVRAEMWVAWTIGK